MAIIFLLIPLTLVLAGIGCWAFFWAVGAGQFDDLDSPAWDVLSDDEPTQCNAVQQECTTANPSNKSQQ